MLRFFLKTGCAFFFSLILAVIFVHLPKPSEKTFRKVFFISSFMFWESSLYSMLLQKDDKGRSHKLNFVIAPVPNRLFFKFCY